MILRGWVACCRALGASKGRMSPSYISVIWTVSLQIPPFPLHIFCQVTFRHSKSTGEWKDLRSHRWILYDGLITITQWSIFSWLLNCLLVHAGLSFQLMEALAEASEQEMKAFSIISTHWDERDFWETVWLFLAWKAKGESDVKPSGESSLPSPTCAGSSSLLPWDGWRQPLPEAALRV